MPDLTPLPPNVTLTPLTPREALAFFQGKVDRAITFHADQLWQAEHNTARTVSRLTDADLIDAIYAQLDGAIAGDVSVRDFTKALRPALQKAGWWGTTEVLNPDTGEILKTTFDSSRLRLIYDVNVRQAHAAGRWARIERNAATHPYILYRTMRDERVRLSHKAWDGVCLPVNDAWWDTHYPPNGWRCRCRAYAISQAEYDKLSKAGELKARPPKAGTIRYLNKSTGQVMEVPAGIDPGWAYNPGKARGAAQADLVRDKLATLAAPVGARLWANLDAPAIALQRQALADLVATVVESKQAVGAAVLAYVVDAPTQAALAAHGVQLESAAVILTDQELLHAVRAAKDNRETALAVETWANLTDWLAGATPYLDADDHALVYAANAAGSAAGKVVVRINYRDKVRMRGKREKLRANFVRTGGLVEASNFENTRYVRLAK